VQKIKDHALVENEGRDRSALGTPLRVVVMMMRLMIDNCRRLVSRQRGGPGVDLIRKPILHLALRPGNLLAHHCLHGGKVTAESTLVGNGRPMQAIPAPKLAARFVAQRSPRGPFFNRSGVRFIRRASECGAAANSESCAEWNLEAGQDDHESRILF
jgi:hypothetical protein